MTHLSLFDPTADERTTNVFFRLAKVGIVVNKLDPDYDRATELRTQIAAHDEAYHGRDEPLVPDAEYDALDSADHLIEDQPDLVTPDSPSGSVGSEPMRCCSMGT